MIRRITRGLGALIVLIAALVGLPWALVVAGAPLLPASSAHQWWRLLAGPDMTGDTLVWLVTLIGWLAWIGFALSVAAEMVNLVSHHRLRLRLPGLSLGQDAAHRLLVTIAAMVAVAAPATGTIAHAAPAPTQVTLSAPAAPAPTQSTPASSPATTPQQDPSSHTTVHQVKAGEYLWQIAERYYGDGARFRQIADANHIDPFADLAVGQDLIIPHPTTTPQTRTVSASQPATVTVGPGDSLSSFAQDRLGDADRWPEIYRLNRAVIGSDPDRIADGTVLRLPGHQVQQKTVEKKTPAPTQAPTSTSTPDKAKTPAPKDTPAPKATASSTRAASPAPVGQNQDDTVTGSRMLMPGIYASVGLLLAAGVVTAVNRRRRRQMATRRRGQQVRLPDESAQATETAMRATAPETVLTITHLDQALRTISAWCAQAGQNLPGLTAARVADDRIDLLLAGPATTCPDGITLTADGSVWTLMAADIDTLTGDVDATHAAAPWPALVTLGHDDAGALILVDLEAAGTLHIACTDPDDATGLIAAIAMELGLCPWAAELNITLVGSLCPGLETALAEPTLTRAENIDDLLDALEARATDQRSHLEDSSVGQKRLDPDLADGWGAEVILTDQTFTDTQDQRLTTILEDLPRVAIAAVTTTGQPAGDWTFTLDGTPLAGHLTPHDWRITPQLAPPEIYTDTLNLLETSATDDTDPAPWWDHDADQAPPLPHDDDTAITTLDPRRLTLAGQIGVVDLDELIDDQPTSESTDDEPGQDPTEVPTGNPDTEPDQDHPTPTPTTESPADATTGQKPDDQVAVDTATPAPDTPTDLTRIGDWVPDHPMLRILGAPELEAAAGTMGRSPRRCLELGLYILTHPGRSAASIADGLYISSSTVKSTATHLRAWLGADDQGVLYFPQAAGGGYRLDERVTTDWGQLQGLLAGKAVNTASTDVLVEALSLVRGKFCEGAAPGDYAWTSELSCQVTMMVTDIALHLTDRALDARDIDLGRWAVAKALACDPGSESLMTARVRVEYQAGNMTEVDKLVTSITATSRQLGSDLADETMDVLAEVNAR